MRKTLLSLSFAAFAAGCADEPTPLERRMEAEDNCEELLFHSRYTSDLSSPCHVWDPFHDEDMVCDDWERRDVDIDEVPRHACIVASDLIDDDAPDDGYRECVAVRCLPGR